MINTRERGQATLEYILMLLIAVSSFVIVSKNLIRPIYKKLSEKLNAQIDHTLSGSLHSFPIGRGPVRNKK